MKKYLNWLIAATLAGGLFFAACSEDFLDAPAQGSLDNLTLANQAGVDAALISAYSMLDGWNADWGVFSPPWGGAGSNWIWGSVTTDEAYKGSEPGDQGEIQQVELYQWAPGNGYFNVKFRALYEGIARANATLKLAAGVADLNNANVIAAEARFLRAHYHFDAWKMWKNVPYYTEADEDFRKPNNEDIVPRIAEDFQFAIQNLPETQNAAGRATKGAAQAYLGKLLLYNKDYSKAKEQFDAVVNSGKYALAPCVKEFFSTGGENGPEMIFSIQASVNDGDSEGSNGNFADRLNHPHGGSPFGCCGFHQPSQNLVNSHKVDANGLPMISTFNNADVALTDAVDPRLDWTVGRDDVPFLDWGTHDPTWIRARSWAGPYSVKKFIHANGQQSSVGWSNVQLSPVNLPIIRYADVLLMLAECEVELGNLERARELVNMIRARAGACAQGPDGGATTDLADPGITWATYKVGTYDSPWSDAVAARNAVRFERKIELAMEGHRLFDLRRWGIAKEVINNEYLPIEKTKRTYLEASGGYEDRHELYPLPSVQIELSKKDGQPQLQQNAGY